MVSEQGCNWAVVVAPEGMVAAGEPSCRSLVIGVVVNPAIVTLMVLVVAVISAVVETFSVVASSTTASPLVLEASLVAHGSGTLLVVVLETADTTAAPEATAAWVVKVLFKGWLSLATFLVILPASSC